LKSPDARKQTPELFVKISKGIAAGMVHLSEEKLVHRDLAARNILLTSSLVPKVSDFGMSRFNATGDDSGKTGSLVGPLRWMSPESLSEGVYSEKTDVYSFGVLLWEIMTFGTQPYPEFIDPVVVGTRVAMGKLTLEAPKGAPASIADAMNSCIKYNPDERPVFRAVIALFPSS